MNRHRLAVAQILGAALLWGTTGTSQAFAPATATPPAVGTVRLVLGGAALVALAGMRRGSFRAPFVPALTAALGVAAYQPTFFAAVDRTGVALGTVVAIGSAPVLAGALGWLVRRERPAKPWYLATLLAVAGVGLIAGSPATVDLLGVVLAVGAGASYAVYATASKPLVERLGVVPGMAVAFGGGALLLAPLLFVVDLSWVTEPSGAVVALWLGLATVAASYLLFGLGLRALDVATVATLSLAEPAVATLLGVAVLDERPGSLGWVGVGLVAAGLVMLAVAGGRHARGGARPGAPSS